MAAPHVTGVVALMKAVDDGLDAARIRKILVETGSPMPGDFLDEVPTGHGDVVRKLRRSMGPLVNAEAALKALVPVNGEEPGPPGSGPPKPKPEPEPVLAPWPPRGSVDEVWADPVHREVLRKLHPRWIREMEADMRRVRGSRYSTDPYCRMTGPGIEILGPPRGRGNGDPVEWCWRHYPQWHRWIEKQPRP